LSAISQTDAFAEETHRSGLIALALLVGAAAQMYAAVSIPIPGAKLALRLGAALLIGASALAAAGFQYRFSRAGLDIRTMGFRLRSIKAADIEGYEIAPWNALGGYGIRGLGGRRAYVWGNRGVRIKTFEGEVFLGHSEPDKIVRDLDLITGKHEAREGVFSS